MNARFKVEQVITTGGGPIKIALNYGPDSIDDIPFLCPSKNIAVNKILIKLRLLSRLIRLVKSEYSKAQFSYSYSVA